MRLLADVGGTNTRCALQVGITPPRALQIMKNDGFADLQSMLESYLAQARPDPAPDSAAIAIAAPVTGDRVRMTNRGWEFSIAGLRERLGLDFLAVINDFTAIARALPYLGPADLQQIGGGKPEPGGSVAVIGPGTGLGVSGLVPAESGWAALAGEGGHVTLPASDGREARVIEILRAQYGHVSAERVLSGSGLLGLYRALAELEGESPEAGSPEEVTDRCRASEPLAVSTVAMFSGLLGTVAANLALTLGARGGVYLAGGIIAKLGEDFPSGVFRARFEDKGRYREYMQAIPTYLLTAQVPALRGLQALLDDARL